MREFSGGHLGGEYSRQGGNAEALRWVYVCLAQSTVKAGVWSKVNAGDSCRR